MIKNKYEISLWEDYLVEKAGEIPEHYEERKICIIGSDSMTAQIRAQEPKLVQNVNGTNTLTFKLFYAYLDNETGEKVKNPFISLLVNERKVKCFWDNQWFDFVVKQIQEDSSGKSITYTCTDLFANELSKTGFSLEFDNELNNNQGTAQELAEKILEGTDWKLDREQSDHILQTIEEPLYKGKTLKAVTAQDKDGNNVSIPSGAEIFVFYSTVQAKDTYFQFLYADSYETETNSQLIINAPCYAKEVSNWIEVEGTSGGYTVDGIFSIPSTAELADYRGDRLVLQQLQEFNKAVGRYCYVFKDKNGQKLLGYSTVEYKDPTVVLNIISNSKEFVDTNGWRGNLVWNLYPPFFNSEIGEAYEATTYLRSSAGTIFNSGLQNSAIYLEDGLQTGQRYYLRIKAFGDGGDAPTENLIDKSNVSFAIYDYFNSLSIDGEVPIHNTTSYCRTVSSTVEDGWIQLEIECTNSIPREKLTTGYLMEYAEGEPQKIAKPGIFLTFGAACWIKEVQFYQKVEGYNGKIIHLGDMDTQSVGTTYYKYFYPNEAYADENDIEYVYYGTEKQSYEKVYEGTEGEYVKFEKIRSISEKNSNRFNLLQNIAETFECWVRFSILHDETTGKIIYVNGFPQKTVYFKEKTGEQLGYGFVYGIDLKSISRSIDSNQIASKVIVSPNISEYANNGICEIAQSEYSETGENYILNFDYYISQGLLNGGEFNKYLYLTTEDGMGFYPSIKAINTEYNSRVEEISAKKNELTNQNSLKTVYEQYVSSAAEQITSLKSQLAFLIGAEEYSFAAVAEYLQSHEDNTNVKNLLTTLTTTEHNKESYTATLEKLETSVGNLTTYINSLEELNDKLLEKKAELEEKFYKKFSRFIQEGSWTSEDYLDENLYYLDAKSVAYTSSRPQISYNISVIRLSALDEFKGKVFNIGDISYIEDTDFFGYVEGKNGWKTPYREEVLISEKTSYFESPEKDTFTVQNYKTQFEDLFQRITATTQSLQYASGGYQRAADIVENDGTINTETLQNSIAINNQLVFTSQNEEIFQDSTGITLSDKNDPSKKTKLTSGGLFISTDGGVTWKNAVRGEGIATQYLTAGAINVNNISIFDGNNPTFRWDMYGLSAYAGTRDENGKLLGINPNTFVRFDHFGVYGISGGEAAKDFIPLSEEEIKETAKFGMTWSGFFLKNREADALIEISNENDFLISKSGIERVKIGRLGNNLYGLRLSDDDGNISLETDDTGSLWLKDRLSISTNDGTCSVSIGKLGPRSYQDEEGNIIQEERSQVFNANNNFIVYEDGSIIANNGTFSGYLSGVTGTFSGELSAATGTFSGELSAATGTFSGRIEATEGRIGGLEISATTTGGGPFATITENSLTLNSGSFAILDREGERAFYTDEVGDLVFKGNLDGASGSFSGDITAASGTIGGFIIGPESLTSTGITVVDGTEMPNIVLYGTEGKIYARNIILGESATIEKNITLGQAKIWNPEVAPEDGDGSHYFLEVGDNVYLTEDGKMSFGSIEIDGSTNNPTIEGKENGVLRWKIDKDSAIFKDITASGGTIENVVFKKSTVQASSGSMIFKPSASGWFEKYNDRENRFYFKDGSDTGLFSEGDVVLLSGTVKSELQEGQDENITVERTILSIGADGSTYCVLDGEASSCNTIIKLYSYKDEILSDDLLIGVNSSQITSTELTRDNYLFKEGFTFISPTIEDGKIVYPALPKLFMGNLAAIGKQGYGLYADNVYLNGTVTTIVGNEEKKTYAGINTISGHMLENSTTDRIVFWAGAASEKEQDVQASPFIVTDTGKLFASDGYFSKSVFVESEIRGSDIYTARIHGTGNESKYSVREPALIIYNTSASSNGIEFRTEDDSGATTGKTLFRICGDAFEAIKTTNSVENTVPFITINNGAVNFSGDIFEGNTFQTNVDIGRRLRLSGNALVREVLNDDETFTEQTGIIFNESDTSFNVKGISVLKAKEELIEAPKDLSAGRNVTFGNTGVTMEYRKVDGGYDLYIHETTNETASSSVVDIAIVDIAIARQEGD